VLEITRLDNVWSWLLIYTLDLLCSHLTKKEYNNDYFNYILYFMPEGNFLNSLKI
jgi:hypothetical protein